MNSSERKKQRVSARDRVLVAAVSKLAVRTVDTVYNGGGKELTRDLVVRAALSLNIEPPPPRADRDELP